MVYKVLTSAQVSLYYPAGERAKTHIGPDQYIQHDTVLLSSRMKGKDRKALQELRGFRYYISPSPISCAFLDTIVAGINSDSL